MNSNNNMIKIGLLIAVFLVSGVFSQSGSAVTPEQRKQANEYFQSQDWTRAIESYRAISNAEPENANALVRLGTALRRLNRLDDAVAAYKKADALQSNPFAAYNLACIYSRRGETDLAFSWLERSLSLGFNNAQQLTTDPDLESVRSDPRFKEFELKLDRTLNPCQHNDEAQQFDFWVGEWDVQTKQGQNAGTNVIQKRENGCVILENWVSSTGGSGTSLNFFDTKISKWRQIWVDSRGTSTIFSGVFKDGSLRYDAVGTDQAGKDILVKMTFTPIDPTHVRQYGEQSTDGGLTWTITFDFIYVRKR